MYPFCFHEFENSIVQAALLCIFKDYMDGRIGRRFRREQLELNKKLPVEPSYPLLK